MKQASEETKRVLQDIMCEIELDAAEAKKAVLKAERDYKTYVRDLYAQKGIYRGLENAKCLIADYCRYTLHISDEEMIQMMKGERYKSEVRDD